MVSATFLWAATRLRTAGAADVAAARLWAALTAAYAEEHDEQKSAQDDQQHCQPVCNKQHHSYTHTHVFVKEITVFSDLRYTMSLTSRSESPDVSPAASMVQK